MTHRSTNVLRWRATAAPAFAVLLALFAADASAGAREQAKRIHDRIAGVPPSDAVLTDMTNKILANDVSAAAYVAMDNTAFYDVTLKNWITPWTNRDFSVFEPLNDYTATVIGMVRGDAAHPGGYDFREILSGNYIFVSDDPNAPAYSNSNNAHYEYLENEHISLKDTLVMRDQSTVTSLPASATAGVWTTRAAAKAFFKDGTNRAQFRYTMVNHMCKDMDQLKDTTRIPDRIRQDVTRSPGGDSRIFLNSCIGCHNGMDPLTQAFAYYDFSYNVDIDPEANAGSLSYNAEGSLPDPFTGTRVKKKYHINAANFKPGYVTPNDHWDNYWRTGPNKLLGWENPEQPASGDGAKTMGVELSHSEQFSRCQVEKVFKLICLRPPVDSADRSRVDSMITTFKTSNYKLKSVVAAAADYCKE